MRFVAVSHSQTPIRAASVAIRKRSALLFRISFLLAGTYVSKRGRAGQRTSQMMPKVQPAMIPRRLSDLN